MKRYLVTFFLWQIARACVTAAGGPTVANSPPSAVSVVASPHSERPAFHIVKKDESLATLKRRYQLSDGEIAAVIALNRLRNPNLIHPGDRLALPKPKSAASTSTSSPAFPWTGRLVIDLMAPMLLTMAPFLIGRTLRRPRRTGFGDSYETWTNTTRDDDWRSDTDSHSSRKTSEGDYTWTRAAGARRTTADQGAKSSSQSKTERPAPRRRGMDIATALSVLGLAQIPTPSVLKSAYRTHALRYHPDRNGGAHDAEEAFKRGGEAYCLLQKYCKDAA